ncbi:MAG: GrpB family protein [Candidatus Thorarchaeota archaeon]
MTYEFKIEEYDPEWKEWFTQLRKYFEYYLSNLIIRIEHVGSTAIPNMVAKPIIDMDIVIKKENFNEIKTKLEEMGYSHQGDLGVEEREAFKLLNDELKQSLLPHHLYVCNQDSKELKRHIIFREFLRNNPKEANEFCRIKRELYKRFSNNKEAYIEAKDSTVKEILRKALKQHANV